MRTPRLPAVDWTDATRRYKWTRPFRWKKKSGFCACAIIFQTKPSYCGTNSQCLLCKRCPWPEVATFHLHECSRTIYLSSFLNLKLHLYCFTFRQWRMFVWGSLVRCRSECWINFVFRVADVCYGIPCLKFWFPARIVTLLSSCHVAYLSKQTSMTEFRPTSSLYRVIQERSSVCFVATLSVTVQVYGTCV